MYEIADQVRTWLAAGWHVTVAQVVATRGFSSRDPMAAAAWTSGASGASGADGGSGENGVDGAAVGSVLAGIDTASLRGLGPGLHEVIVSDVEAARAGLACGGAASVLVQSAGELGADTWSRLAAREPVCLVTPLPAGPTSVYTPPTIREAPGDQVPRLFARGVSTSAVLDDVAVVALWPVPTLVVVGDGLLADALADTAGLLGWTSAVTADVDDAVAAAQRLYRSDAFVVLSHSREVDGPALSAALSGPVGYVGALGSRRTQAARREWLTERGVPDDDQARIHGPAGLDIDAHTPAEIAISIVAEILGSRSQSSGGALRDRSGPVHVDGVNAPPPRYA